MGGQTMPTDSHFEFQGKAPQRLINSPKTQQSKEKTRRQKLVELTNSQRSSIIDSSSAIHPLYQPSSYPPSQKKSPSVNSSIMRVNPNEYQEILH